MEVEHGRRALAQASAAFFGHPERQLAAIGITGTNGKTTTAYLIEALLNAARRKTVLVGTIEYHVAGEVRPSVHTTPESRDLYELMAEGVAKGATELVTEVSSHAPRPGPCRRLELRCRRLHQPHPRPSGLSPDDGEVLRRQAPALRRHGLSRAACRGHKGRDLRLKIANIPTAEEMIAVQAADEFKGYLWIKRVKVELISRAISWIDGIDINNLAPDQRFVPDPTDPDRKVRDTQVVLRNVIMGWGQELTEVLWKVLMTHSQNIEDRLKEQFPSNAIMTEVEQRLFERARKQMDENMKIIQDEQVAALYDTSTEPIEEDRQPEKVS